MNTKFTQTTVCEVLNDNGKEYILPAMIFDDKKPENNIVRVAFSDNYPGSTAIKLSA